MQIGLGEVGQLSIVGFWCGSKHFLWRYDSVVIIRHRDWQGHEVRMIMVTFQSWWNNLSTSFTFVPFAQFHGCFTLYTMHVTDNRYNMLKAGFKAQRLAPTIPRSTSPWVSTLGGPFYPPPFLVSVSAMQLTSSQDTAVCSTLGSGQLWDLGWNTASVWILLSCQNLVGHTTPEWVSWSWTCW